MNDVLTRPAAPPPAWRLQDPLSFAIVFGIVAGMMVYVSIKELLPSAFQFDPKDKVVSTSESVHVAVHPANAAIDVC